MKRTQLIIAGGLLILAVVIVVIIALTAAYTPENTNPAFDAAVTFVQAAGSGDDDLAFNMLTPQMQTYVQDHCPDGSVSACVKAYTPPEWGAFRSVVFRRASPAGQSAWDVDLIATYEQGKGFSGVCIYNHVVEDETGAWQVAGWAGFVSCGDGASRNMASNPDAPNHAP